MGRAFAAFVVSVLLLVWAVALGQRLVDRLVTGDWVTLPPCAAARRRAARRENRAPHSA